MLNVQMNFFIVNARVKNKRKKNKMKKIVKYFKIIFALLLLN